MVEGGGGLVIAAFFLAHNYVSEQFGNYVEYGSYYDFSVLPMSVMGYKKSLDGGVLYQLFFDVWNSFKFAKPLSLYHKHSPR